MNKPKFHNCPKCQAEIRQVAFGELVIDYCPACGGMFVDYRELEHKDIQEFEDMEKRKRCDDHELNEISIKCPKCEVEMVKKKGARRHMPMIDMCPKCKGVWFDQGELKQFRSKKPLTGEKAEQLSVNLVCVTCDLKTDLESAIKENQRVPTCPRCHGTLSFEGVGEVVVQRWEQKQKAFVLWLCGTTFGSFLLFLPFSEKAYHAAALSIVVAMGMIILLRALIYNRFTARSGIVGPAFVRDFKLN